MPMNTQKLRRGDSFRHLSAGGGGYGDPFERDPAAVLEDVLDEKVSVAAAKAAYGVVVHEARGQIDGPATGALRRRPRALRVAS
jgi:N-methylhydantoinase B